MSPRRNRRQPGQPARQPAAGSPQVEQWAGGDWLVRPVSGAAATKVYRCPGCDQEIKVGVAHLVTWPADQVGVAPSAGPAERRHWHRPCWAARDRRHAKNPRTRDAPRYG